MLRPSAVASTAPIASASAPNASTSVRAPRADAIAAVPATSTARFCAPRSESITVRYVSSVGSTSVATSAAAAESSPCFFRAAALSNAAACALRATRARPSSARAAESTTSVSSRANRAVIRVRASATCVVARSASAPCTTKSASFARAASLMASRSVAAVYAVCHRCSASSRIVPSRTRSRSTERLAVAQTRRRRVPKPRRRRCWIESCLMAPTRIMVAAASGAATRPRDDCRSAGRNRCVLARGLRWLKPIG